MTFDAEKAKALLNTLNDQVYAVRKLYGVKSRTKSIAKARAVLGDIGETYYTVENLPMKAMSNHGRIIEEGAEKRACEVLTELVEMVAQVAPVLRANDIDIYLNIGLMRFKRPYFTMHINDMTLGPRGNNQDIDECVDRLAFALTRIADVNPGEREFELDERYTIKAATPDDAYRVYAALAKPGLFDAEIASGGRDVKMTEVLKIDTYQAALLAA